MKEFHCGLIDQILCRCPNRNNCCAARWIYYDPKDHEKMVLQYGNPEQKDVAVIVHTHEIETEIKDMPARHKERDLYYDENGKFIISDAIKNECSEYIPFINKFNNTTDVFTMAGHNYKLDPDAIRKLVFEEGAEDFDLLMTSKGNKLIILKATDLNASIDGDPILNTSGSEIRMTGKNHVGVFTPEYLEQLLEKKNLALPDSSYCIIHEDETYIANDKGTGKPSRLKLEPNFFVPLKHTTYSNGKYTFEKKHIRQLKCTIAVHINLNFGEKEIYEALYEK